jgi:hypothetical protein
LRTPGATSQTHSHPPLLVDCCDQHNAKLLLQIRVCKEAH